MVVVAMLSRKVVKRRYVMMRDTGIKELMNSKLCLKPSVTVIQVMESGGKGGMKTLNSVKRKPLQQLGNSLDSPSEQEKQSNQPMQGKGARTAVLHRFLFFGLFRRHPAGHAVIIATKEPHPGWTIETRSSTLRVQALLCRPRAAL